MPIKDWNEDDRPREKLMSTGASSCTVAELIAILITNGSKNKSAIELADEVLYQFDNDLIKFVRGNLSDYQTVVGIGPAKACILKAAAELGRRIGDARLSDEVVKVLSPESAYQHMSFLCQIMKEEFWCIYTNNSGLLLGKKKISEGSGGEVQVDLRKIVSYAIDFNATRVILCHNHPGGTCSPSNDDIALTKNIKSMLNYLKISVVEHLIVAGNSYYSFLENDLL
ncbi:MAG: DNA repair protein RadC [Bacteroidales bacterium]|nr:DNA repair protein RadC [Bacteroidales bacterium]